MKNHYKNHYVYRITHLVENKHYYGVRSSKVDPKMDLGITYFSSSRDKEFRQDQKENPQNYKYKVIRIFETRLEAALLEMLLHKKFNVGVNKSFYNRAIQSSTGFDVSGITMSEEQKAKLSKAQKQKCRTMSAENKQKLIEANTGRIQSDETRAKISEAGKNISDETRAKMSKVRKGKPLSDETKAKLSKVLKGKIRSDETKAKMSQSRTGKPLSDEIKVNMSKAQKGRIRSDETKAKMSKAQKGKTHSDETKAKMSKAQKGKTHSDETKVKISTTRKGKIYIRNSLETKEKLINPNDFPEYEKFGWICGRGKTMSAETRAKISKTHKGRTLSDEHKQNMSTAAKARKGKIYIHNILENKEKLINPDDFPEYEKLGWVRGRKKS